MDKNDNNFMKWIAPGLKTDETTKGGPGSGNFGHVGRIGEIGGSASGGGKGNLSMTEADEILKQTLENGGFTYQPLSDTSPTSGCAVAVYPERCQKISAKDIKKSDIRNYVKKNLDIFRKDPAAHLGTWYNKENGLVYLDISQVHPKKKAAQIAKERGELAIFDFETFNEIPNSDYDKIIETPD